MHDVLKRVIFLFNFLRACVDLKKWRGFQHIVWVLFVNFVAKKKVNDIRYETKKSLKLKLNFVALTKTDPAPGIEKIQIHIPDFWAIDLSINQ